MFLSAVARFLFLLMGWTFEPLPPYFKQRHVIIGFPHTSNMDSVRAFTGFRIVRRKGHIMVKREWFFWPMSLLLRWLGGIPTDRKAPQGLVQQMADHFRSRDEFLLAIVPEGTRKGVRTIRTGFWHIAKAANVSILCWYLDNKMRRTRWLGEIFPGDDMAADLLTIRALYQAAGYTFPLELDAPAATKPQQ